MATNGAVVQRRILAKKFTRNFSVFLDDFVAKPRSDPKLQPALPSLSAIAANTSLNHHIASYLTVSDLPKRGLPSYGLLPNASLYAARNSQQIAV